MHARDASGRQVSLLNDDTAAPLSQVSQRHESAPQYLTYRTASHMSAASYHGSYGRSPSPFPNTPELLRSDSYDSQMSNEPISPITPMYDYSGARIYTTDARSPYEDYYPDPQQQMLLQQQTHAHTYTSGKQLHQPGSDSTAYDEETTAGGGHALGAPGGKRYPCRYRESHGCEKTFTTSGHASRHSKIHTAEKAVQCTFAGCSKKFTRADNMKQHLETHYKDKSRNSSSSSSSSSSRPSLSSERRSSSSTTSGKSSSRSSKSSSASGTTSRTTPLSSPSIRSGAWDFRGLDALAMAVACQEGS